LIRLLRKTQDRGTLQRAILALSFKIIVMQYAAFDYRLKVKKERRKKRLNAANFFFEQEEECICGSGIA